MDRERLKGTLKDLAESTINPEDDTVDGFKLRYFLKEIIDALLEDDKPKIDIVEEREECKLTTIKIKHNWTPEEVKAIKESIIHWRDNVSRLKLANELGIEIVRGIILERWEDVSNIKEIAYFNAGYCPLCMTYRVGCNCSRCPLSRSGNECNPENSAWGKCSKAQGNKEIIEAAENMVHTLESLLE